MLEDCDAAIWLGDMNWTGEREMDEIAVGWSDLWKEISADEGPTFHGNQGAAYPTPTRLDRILTKGVNGEAMMLLSTSRISGTNSFPSDHYGLFAVVSFRQV